MSQTTTTAYPPITDRPVRWGLLAAGKIARALAAAIRDCEGGEVIAVAARDAVRASAFAQEQQIPISYGSYAELLADPEVDVVYISSTHPFHAEQALPALEAGKHVLVEKPTALTVHDTEQILETARERGRFAMEAMWTRCMPVVRELVERVQGGQIGRVRSFHAAFTVPFEYDESHRVFDLANGGGALLDIGIYPVTLAHLLLGHPTDVQVLGSTAPTGADTQVALQWMGSDGAVAQVICDSQSAGDSSTVVRGTQGWIEVHGPVNNPEGFTVHRTGRTDPMMPEAAEELAEEPAEAAEAAEVDAGPAQATPGPAEPEHVGGDRRGYVHEVEEVHRCLREGLLESPLVPHADTVAIMTILESARRELGVQYPQEAEPLHS